jgi:hypothetical protein
MATSPARIQISPSELAEVLDHALHLCLSAARSVGHAKLSRERARRSREAWAGWRAVWRESGKHPDHILVCCAYCARLRRDTGEWVAIPTQMSEALHHPPASVSHSFCPDCLARHFPPEPDSSRRADHPVGV